MPNKYIKNLIENYPNVFLRINTLIRLDPRRTNYIHPKHEDPQAKTQRPKKQFQIVIPHEIPYNVTSPQYLRPKSEKKKSPQNFLSPSNKKRNPMILNLMTPKKNSKMLSLLNHIHHIILQKTFAIISIRSISANP